MEQFDHDYYQKLLQSLTINSRAVITELATIAEQNVEKAQEISDMVEIRIKKALPQHKLYGMYLLDSICKNIGSPYNLIFAKNLYRVFTETYTFVADTTTRQNLINLFKTWTNAKTGTGLPLFPQELIKKIEKFIINATSIPNGGNGNNFSQNSTSNIASGAVAGNTTFNNINLARLTPDMLLREARVLLTYIINLDNGIAKLDIPTDWLSEKDLKTLENLEIKRNQLVWNINDLTDRITGFLSKREDFDKSYFHNGFVTIRRELDEQSYTQNDIIKRVAPKLKARQKRIDLKRQRLKNHQQYDEFFNFIDNEDPKEKNGMNGGSTNGDATELKWDETNVNDIGSNWEQELESDNKANPLGFDFNTFDFDTKDEKAKNLLGIDIADFSLSNEKDETSSKEQENKPLADDPYIVEDDSDDELRIKSPTPMNYQTGQDADDDDADYIPYEPPMPTVPLKSSLKRKQEVSSNVEKRVRFDV